MSYFVFYCYLVIYIYTRGCLPFNELLSSNCLNFLLLIHLPIKTFVHVTNVVKRRRV